MLQAKPYVFWFVTGSQGLYGEDVLEQVEDNSRKMVEELNREGAFRIRLSSAKRSRLRKRFCECALKPIPAGPAQG